MKYIVMIRLTADQTIDAEVTTIPRELSCWTMIVSKATPKAIQSEPMTRYTVIIIVKLPVINIFEG